MRIITKTSKQAKLERERKNAGSCNKCPECGVHSIGILSTLNGIFKTKTMKSFRCMECGCEWNTGWSNE